MMYFKRWLSFGAGMLCAVLSVPAGANPPGGHSLGGMRSMPAQMQTEMLRRFEPPQRRSQIDVAPRPAIQMSPRFFMLTARSPWLFGQAASRFNLACVERPGTAIASSASVFGPPLFSGLGGSSVLAACDGRTSPLHDEAPATLVPAHDKNALYGRGYWPDAESVK